MSETLGPAVHIILFCFISLLLSILAIETKKKFKVPVSPCLIFLGLLVRTLGEHIPGLTASVSLVDQQIGMVVQLVIIPALIFEAAFTTYWYNFKKQIVKIIIMATSVVLISTVLTAIVYKYILQYRCSWEEALIIGLILSATDHVALQTVFKDAHTNEKFEVILEGETLLNEVTVLVIYRVVSQSIGTSQSHLSLFAFFIRYFFGGFCMGAAFAGVMALLLRRIVNDFVQETNITIVTTYLLFWVCTNSSVSFSGASAVMVLGLFMSSYGKTLISPVVGKELEMVWKLISTNLQCIVFITAGMILETFFVVNSAFGLLDYFFVLILFIFLRIIRAITVALHYPLLQYFGYRINLNEIVALTFAGMRGVISLAVSLIAFNDPALNNAFQNSILFFTINVVVLSIVIDASLLRYMLRRFKMDVLSPVQENILLGATTTIIKQTKKNMKTIAEKADSILVKWEEVEKIAGPRTILLEIMKKSAIGKEILGEFEDESAENLIEIYNSRFNLSFEVLMTEIRRRFFCILKSIYWYSFEVGECLSSSALLLINSCNKALDIENQDMDDWAEIEKSIYSQRKMDFYKKYQNTPFIGRIFRRLMYNTIIHAYDVAHTYIRAHYSAEAIMDSLDIDIDEDIVINVMEEAHSQIIKCQRFITTFITDSYPEIISDVLTKMISFSMLFKQRKLVGKIYRQGGVKEQEYKHLINAVDSNFELFTFMATPRIPTLAEMLSNRFKKASREQIKRMLPFVLDKHYQPNSYIFSEGEKPSGVFLIFSGSVSEYGNALQHILTISNIAGAYCMVDRRGEYLTTCRTRSVVIAAFIPFECLNADSFVEDLYREAAKHTVLFQKEMFGLADAMVEHIERVVENSCVWYVQAGSPVNLKRGAMVLRGRVRKDKGQYSVVRPSKRIIESAEAAVVLFFPPHFGAILRQHRELANAFAIYFIKYKSRKEKDKIEN
jgi:NhaP-type Na+/H+ or K+/H+ antiporter